MEVTMKPVNRHKFVIFFAILNGIGAILNAGSGFFLLAALNVLGMELMVRELEKARE
jgi:hypothetical protein